ncbi:MAG: TetR/AcrR family transcriptional regulator [Candidatus Odinarchaeota archaeon]
MIEQKKTKKIDKKSRSRSPEKKAAQFEKILEAGKQLFLEKGRDGFSLRALARSLGMNQNNLYNYVASKRELWLAIRKKYYEQYRNDIRELIKDFSGTTIDLLLVIFEHFFESAEKDFSAFRMMHFMQSPPSNKLGKFEKEYKPFKFLEGTTRVIQKAIDQGEIKEKNAALVTFFLFSLLLGSALVEEAMRVNERKSDEERKKIQELKQFGAQAFTSKDFRKYILLKIKKGLSDPNLIVDDTEYKK